MDFAASQLTVFLIQQFLRNQALNTVVMPQSPYSLDIALLNCFLSPKVKLALKDDRFCTIDGIKEK